MASETENLNGKLEVDDGKLANFDFHVNKKLRDSGLEYISRTGKTIAAKKQPEELCNCPQRCGDKIPEEVRKYLFIEFYKMADHIQQNNFLQTYIEMRSVRKRLWDDDEQRIGGRLQRRVSCKYHVPTEIPKDEAKDENKPGDKSNSDKAQSNIRKPAPKPKVNTVEVCQKAFMNTYAITEKRIRLQREKLITKSRKDAGIQSTIVKEPSQEWTHDLIAEIGPLLMNREILANISTIENNTLPPDIPSKILHAIDNDISIVNNFFCNQLWQPEYIDYNFGKSSLANGTHDDYPKPVPSSLISKKSTEMIPNNIHTANSYSIEKCNAVSASKKPVLDSILHRPATNNNEALDYSTPKPNKTISVDYPVSSTPKSLNNSTSKNNSSVKSTSPSKYMSFENSSISITPVNSKSISNSSSSSIFNSINFGNSSISITPLYRQ